MPAELPKTQSAPPFNAALVFANALALHQAGRLAEAETLYRQILAVRPDDFDCLHFLGVIAHQRGNHAEAVRQIDIALLRHPDDAFALNNRGNALLALKRYDEALESYDRALAQKPDYDDALCNRGAALHELRRYEEALADCDRAIAMRPDHEEAHSNRGNTLKELRRFDEALASCDRALALRADFPAAHCNRANALHSLDRFEEALAGYRQAIALQPHYPEALTNRGVTLHDLRRFDEALASYRQALAVEPDYAEAHFREAMWRLLTGDLARGWAKQEWRWKSRQLAGAGRNFRQPLWLGTDEIAGKTILIHAEQGFGDTIQFCRYLPHVAERAERVILEIPDPLQELMATLPGGAQIVSRGTLPDFDLHCPLLSLPLAFGTELATTPSATPYLRAQADQVGRWSDRLGAKTRPRIGLVWSGNAAHKNDHRRSIGLASFLSILDGIGATFVSLQRDVRADDAAVLRHRGDIVHFGAELKTFSDTAALIMNLDLVISVDTAVAHLAGALAKPVWVLLPFIPDWRWLLDRDDSPWYPTARLFRQDATRTWGGTLARVRAALDRHFGNA